MKTAIGILATATILSAASVDIMAGSRGFSMGGGYSAIVDDASAAYWNPAGLGKLKTMTLMNSNWILQDVEGLNLNYFTAAFPVKDLFTISGSWLLTHASLEEGWNDATNAPERTNSANDHQFSLSAGKVLWEKLGIFRTTAIGFTLNRYALDLSDDNEDKGAGLGFDLGTQLGFPAGFNLAFTAKNLGTEIMGVKVDPELRWGLGWTNLFNETHRVSFDVDAALKKNRDYEDIATLTPAEQNIRVFGGLEYGILFKDFEIGLSGGVNTNQYNSRDSHNFAGGLGFKWKSHALQYGFGGATEVEKTLGYSHRVTLSVALGDLIGKGATKTAMNME